MSSFRDTTIPATSRAVSLVRQHHGAPTHGEEILSAGAALAGRSLNRVWKKEARANHLRAQRRVVRLDEIPEAQLPAILEVSGGTNFVVLTERLNARELRIQFPDARETVVDRERLLEVYDGQCVFLNPRDSRRIGGGGGKLSRWKNVFRSVRPSSSGFGTALFNLVVLASAMLLVHFQGGVFQSYGRRSVLIPLLAALASGLTIAGIFQMRRDMLGRKGVSDWIDMAFVPIFLSLAVAAGAWASLPFLVICAVVFSYLLISSRLGSVSSRLHGCRKSLVGIAFLLGTGSASFFALQGTLHPGLMAGTVVLGSYATYLLSKSDILWQQARLEAWT